MNEFNERKNCSKCNSKRFSKVDGRDLLKFTYVSEYMEDDDKIVPEHLDVMCRVCGYIWQEKCFS